MIALDTNADGEISAGEIDAAAKSLATLDKNGDGRITNDEVTPAPGRGPGGRGQ
jgi:Ca2+-binding EF-hand superfamily protein